MKKETAALSLAAFLLVSCGSSKTMVIQPFDMQGKNKRIYLVKDQDTASVPAEVSKRFEEILSEKLFKESNLPQGQDISLKYRFIQCNEGNQFKRWIFGGIGNAGEGTMTVEVRYIDHTQNDREIGKIQTEGKIGSGFFGGSFDHAVEGAAQEITEYTKKSIAS